MCLFRENKQIKRKRKIKIGMLTMPQKFLNKLVTKQFLMVEVRMNTLCLLKTFYIMATLFNMYTDEDIPEITKYSLEEMKKEILEKILFHQNISKHIKEICRTLFNLYQFQFEIRVDDNGDFINISKTDHLTWVIEESLRTKKRCSIQCICFTTLNPGIKTPTKGNDASYVPIFDNLPTEKPPPVPEEIPKPEAEILEEDVELDTKKEEEDGNKKAGDKYFDSNDLSDYSFDSNGNVRFEIKKWTLYFENIKNSKAIDTKTVLKAEGLDLCSKEDLETNLFIK